jgi:hypothetical protein
VYDPDELDRGKVGDWLAAASRHDPRQGFGFAVVEQLCQEIGRLDVVIAEMQHGERGAVMSDVGTGDL